MKIIHCSDLHFDSKMETNIVSPVNGKVESVTVKDGEMVEAGQLLLRLE